MISVSRQRTSYHLSPTVCTYRRSYVLLSFSLAGSEDALASLLRANALQAIVRALFNSQALAIISLKSALARALRVLASAIIEVTGPTLGPIRVYSAQFRSEAKVALSYLFEVRLILIHTAYSHIFFSQFDCLDVYLPLLADASIHTSVAIAQLIGAAVRTEVHRNAVIEWLPRMERQREVKSRRGWERPLVVQVTTKHGAWVIRTLVAMIQKKDLKVRFLSAVRLSDIDLSLGTRCRIVCPCRACSRQPTCCYCVGKVAY